MTQHQVENTRVNFWTFSPVSVKLRIKHFSFFITLKCWDKSSSEKYSGTFSKAGMFGSECLSWTDENIENVEEIFKLFAGEKINICLSRNNIFGYENVLKRELKDFGKNL